MSPQLTGCPRRVFQAGVGRAMLQPELCAAAALMLLGAAVSLCIRCQRSGKSRRLPALPIHSVPRPLPALPCPARSVSCPSTLCPARPLRALPIHSVPCPARSVPCPLRVLPCPGCIFPLECPRSVDWAVLSFAFAGMLPQL